MEWRAAAPRCFQMEIPPDLVRADFDRIAEASRHLPDRVEPLVAALVEDVPPGARVLEVGCGAGALARHLAARGAEVTAIDLSPAMIEVARAGGGDIDYRVADLMTWKGGNFDRVVSVAALHHLPLAAALARLRAMLVPGGALAVVDLFDGMRLVEAPYGVLSLLARAARRRPPHDPALAAAWAAHGAHDRLLALAAIRRTWRAALPGARVRRHLGWRYSARWSAAIRTGRGA